MLPLVEGNQARFARIRSFMFHVGGSHLFVLSLEIIVVLVEIVLLEAIVAGGQISFDQGRVDRRVGFSKKR